jgi:diadenylate cyclase
MDAFEVYINNLNAWAIVDLVLLLTVVGLMIAFVIRKKNIRLALILAGYVVLDVSVSVLSALLGGTILYGSTVVLRYFTMFLIVAMCVVYQADLKAIFSKISRTWEDDAYSAHNTSEDDLHDAAKEIIKATQHMSKNDIGALIIICPSNVPNNVIETGTKVDALLSAEILECIFNTKSPLHDGAVVVKNNVLLAAGCFLPLSQDPTISKELGTRHRAAVGITEESDVVAIVVSEETGIISVMRKGEIKRYMTSDKLMEILENTYGINYISRSSARRASKKQ